MTISRGLAALRQRHGLSESACLTRRCYTLSPMIVLTRRVVPYWLVRLRTMPLFLSRSLMMAERLAATLAAASFLAATCRSPLCVEADRGNPNIFLHAA